MREIAEEKLIKYFEVTQRALTKAKESPENLSITDLTRKDFIDMVENYLKDAIHFKEKGEIVNAFAALNYAHGWLDAGARIGIFDVHDSELFAKD
ncbi:DUF357 domain-containing protein [Candidatus Woesearchaeota archaeon]|nr:DUF357 domain-containing protein [Candidatus Woesearchaeota archaeon]